MTEIVMGNVVPLRKKIEELEVRLARVTSENTRLRGRVLEMGWKEEKHPRYDSYGQFDGYYS